MQRDQTSQTIGALLCAPYNGSSVAYTRPLLVIERIFDHCAAFTWFSDNWTLCYYLIGVYLVAIAAGSGYMRNRPPFQLRGALVLWNAALAAYSAVSAWRMLTALVYAVRIFGLHTTVCHAGPYEHRQALALWNFLFSFSKFVEFGDTAFLVLRKRQLIFLHWYHHVSVTFFAWSPGAYGSPIQAFFTTTNLCVHAVMYAYYALTGLRIRVPKPISAAVTAMQVLQMAAMIGITVYAYKARVVDPACYVPDGALAIAGSIYFSYFVLFCNFFLRAYVRGRPASSELKKLS